MEKKYSPVKKNRPDISPLVIRASCNLWAEMNKKQNASFFFL